MPDGEGALGHRSRKLIFNFISTNPGASFETIKKFFDMNKSTLNYHLKYLERNKQISSKLEGKCRCYYCELKKKHFIHPYLREKQPTLTKTQQQLITIIQNNPGVSNKDLIAKIKINRKNLSYNIKKLREQKLIWAVQNDGVLGYEYVTNEKLRHEMVARLISKLLADEIDEETYHKLKKKLETIDIDELMK